MCGVVGIVKYTSAVKVDNQTLNMMNDSLLHRGPDDSGIYFNNEVGLGHRRLSIIDVSQGHQPLFNEDGTVVIVFNGEIYNYKSLKEYLRRKSHIFSTDTDTEVIVHGWEEWGVDCVKHLQGMFVFAIYDIKKQTVFIARDRIGIKPLYYSYLDDGQLIFGSELKSLIRHPAVDKSLNPEAIEDFFAYGYIPDPKTIYSTIYKLEPATSMTIDLAKKTTTYDTYWDLRNSNKSNKNSSHIEQDLEELLNETVNSHMISDVPIGAFLSGGIDSSAVVAYTSKNYEGILNTFSISFSGTKQDESRYSQIVADKFGTQHHINNVSYKNLNILELLIDLYDEPFADNSAVPTYFLCKTTGENVKVALSGDGGDEAFAGYETYLYHLNKNKIRSHLPSGIKTLFGKVGKIYPKADWAPRIFRAKSTLETLSMSSTDSFAYSAMITLPYVRKRLFSRKFHNQLQGYTAFEVMKKYGNDTKDGSELSNALYLDYKTYLPGDILTKVDRASMRNSLEVRVPLLDHKFVEWAYSLPDNMKLNGSQSKYLLKKILKKYLPDEIIYRKKMGFDIPLKQWVKAILFERTAPLHQSKILESCEIFDMEYIKQMEYQFHKSIVDHSMPLWSLLIFETFMFRQYS